MSEQYYLIKKIDVDALKSSLPNTLESEFDAGKYATLSMIGVELGEVIDLSDEAIKDNSGKSWKDCNNFFENSGGVNPTPYMMGYNAALKDLIKPKK
jgi:hypothetical protein